MNASAQQADQATSDAVIAMVKGQWASEIKDPTNVAEQPKDVPDDYTEFNGDYATCFSFAGILDRVRDWIAPNGFSVRRTG